MNLLFKKFFISLLVVSFVFCSCSKNEKAEDENRDGTVFSDEIDESENKSEYFSEKVTGVIYVNKAGLYTETEDGKMKWAAEASLGDEPVYLGEKKEALRTDGQKRGFFHVMFKDKEYWIQDYSYEPATVPAFISAPEAILYKSDSLTAVTGEIIPQYLPVAVYKDSLQDENSKFVKIAAYSPEFISSWSIKEKFVKRDAVIMDPDSTAAMFLAQVAMESRNDTIRTELFQNAIEMGTGFTDDIAALKELAEIIIREENFMKNLSPEKINVKVSVNKETELLSIPQSGEARILNTLKENSSAVALRKIIIKTQEDDEGEEWFFVQDKQKKGWIKSKELEIKDK